MCTCYALDKGQLTFSVKGPIAHTIPQRNILSCLSPYLWLQNPSRLTPGIASCLQGKTSLECPWKHNTSGMDVIMSLITRIALSKSNSSICLTFPRRISTPMLFCFSSDNSHRFPFHLSSSCWTLTYPSRPRSDVTTSQWWFPPSTPLPAAAVLGDGLCLPWMVIVICAYIYLPHWNVSSRRTVLLSILMQKLIQINENTTGQYYQRGNWDKSCKF